MYNREELLVKVASLFYEGNKTQTQISKELGISRPTVASILSEAKEKEIVQIIISHPNKLVLKNERVLRNFFPNTRILVAPQSSGNAKESVGLITAKLLKDLLPEVNSIGIGWGSTLSEVIKAFDYIKVNKLSVVPLIGGMINYDAQYHSNHLVSSLTTKLNGEAKAEYLYAPAIADSVEIKKHFVENNLVKDVITKAKKVDLALVGIGNPMVNSNYQEHGYISEVEIEELREENVIGDILTSFFRSDGDVIKSKISDRMIGLNIGDLEKINLVVAAATGEEKTQSALVTLKNELIDYLVIDEILANSLVDVLVTEEELKQKDKEE